MLRCETSNKCSNLSAGDYLLAWVGMALPSGYVLIMALCEHMGELHSVASVIIDYMRADSAIGFFKKI